MTAVTPTLAPNRPFTFQQLADHPKTITAIILGLGAVGLSAMYSVAAAVATAAALILCAMAYLVISHLFRDATPPIKTANAAPVTASNAAPICAAQIDLTKSIKTVTLTATNPNSVSEAPEGSIKSAKVATAANPAQIQPANVVPIAAVSKTPVSEVDANAIKAVVVAPISVDQKPQLSEAEGVFLDIYRLLGDYLSEDEKMEIEESLLKFPPNERVDFIKAVKLMLPDPVNGADCIKMIDILYTIPANERVPFINMIHPFLPPKMHIDDKLYLIALLSAMSSEERKDFLDLVEQLRSDALTNAEIISIFKNLGKIPTNERADFIATIKKLVLEKKQGCEEILTAVSGPLQYIEERPEQIKFICSVMHAIETVEKERKIFSYLDKYR